MNDTKNPVNGQYVVTEADKAAAKEAMVSVDYILAGGGQSYLGEDRFQLLQRAIAESMAKARTEAAAQPQGAVDEVGTWVGSLAIAEQAEDELVKKLGCYDPEAVDRTVCRAIISKHVTAYAASQTAEAMAVIAELEAALKRLLADVKASKKLEGREYIQTGIQVNDAIERARAYQNGQPATGGDGWLPIESAPKDGRDILVSDGPGEDPYITSWTDDAYRQNGGRGGPSGWINGFWNDRPQMNNPKVWQPLPAAPAQNGGKAGD